jgi:hypothetical protein
MGKPGIIDDNDDGELYLWRVGYEMKRVMFLTLFLSSSILVYSQNRADTTLYIAPISGGSEGDQAFFSENLRMEVNAAGYNVVDDSADAIYSISGTIAPEDDGSVLSMTLINVKESREMVTQELFYIKVEESYEVLPFLIWQMLANAPFVTTDAPSVVVTEGSGGGRLTPIVNLINTVPHDDTWKNKWIYLGAKIGVSLHLSSGDVKNQTIPYTAGILAAVQVLDFLDVQLEFDFDMDSWAYTPESETQSYNPVYLYMPLLVKGVLKPGKIFLVEPYGGAYLNIPLDVPSQMTLPWGGVLGGFEFGFKVGSGILFVDLRYLRDIGDTTIVPDGKPSVEFTRQAVTISGGYKIGFLNRKQSATRFRGARY